MRIRCGDWGEVARDRIRPGRPHRSTPDRGAGNSPGDRPQPTSWAMAINPVMSGSARRWTISRPCRSACTKRWWRRHARCELIRVCGSSSLSTNSPTVYAPPLRDDLGVTAEHHTLDQRSPTPSRRASDRPLVPIRAVYVVAYSPRRTPSGVRCAASEIVSSAAQCVSASPQHLQRNSRNHEQDPDRPE